MSERVWQANLDRAGPIWSWFDPEHYARYDAQAAQATRNGLESALQDFNQRGVLLGHSPSVFFDTGYYLAANPDVCAAIADGASRSAFEHYCTVGFRDRDAHWLFDIGFYQGNYPDLVAETVADSGGLYAHFLQYGMRERRRGHRLFDASFYLKQLPIADADAAASDPFRHFLAARQPARPEPQGSLYFDPQWYLATYADVAAAVLAGGYQGALHHYITIGAKQGRDPLCDFSETEYRLSNPDVDRAIKHGNFHSAYDHFLQFGAHDNRSPADHLDLAWYARQPRVARDLHTGAFANAFEHFLKVGLSRGLPLRPPVAIDFALDEDQSRAAFFSQARRALPGFGRRPLDFTLVGAPDLSVIIVLRNQFALTMQSLASLRHTYGGAIQLIIVDNASNDETRGITDIVTGAELIRLEENVGFLRACNLALAAVTAPYTLYLNNDVLLEPFAVQAARGRLAEDPTVGAVGGKIIRTHGLLQEAGCIIWRDGSTSGWMRDAPPDAPEANYVRDVDFCSGAFLMVRSSLLQSLAGFDPAFAPAYYEETDLCLRIQQAGFRVVYDPAVTLIHYEYGSARNARAATSQILANRTKLRTQHAASLRRRVSDRSRSAEAAAFASRGRRVLFIEDVVPIHRLGSGFCRAADMLCELVSAGWQATVFPMLPVETPLFQITADLPDTVEILWNRNRTSLLSFLEERRGYYDLVWSSRAHNLRQLQEIIGPANDVIGSARLVLDTEAIFSLRESTRAELDGLPFDFSRALARELEGSWLCDHVVAVSEAEAEILTAFPLPSVGVIGTRISRQPTTKSWSARHGILHVGALWAEDSPNYDGLRWYLEHVQPALERLIGVDAARLTVAGHVADNMDTTWLKQHPSVDMLGSIADLEPLFNDHRVFVAPTRYAAGVAFKLVDAAAFGLPIACTTVLSRQLGSADGSELLSASYREPDQFAQNVAAIYTDAGLWRQQRDRALRVAALNFSPARFTEQVAAAVQAAGLQPPKRVPPKLQEAPLEEAVPKPPSNGATPPPAQTRPSQRRRRGATRDQPALPAD